MSTIDWSKAPDDATHAFFNSGNFLGWRKLIDGEWHSLYEVGAGGWSLTTAPMEEGYVARPVTEPGPESWTGEGLPPVGTELEVGFACEDFEIWHKGLCVAVGEDPEGRTDFCVVKVGKKIAMYTTEAKRMRPIRTAEQIAAEERESHINGMLCHDALGGTRRGLAEALYDAGYRKQVQP